MEEIKPMKIWKAEYKHGLMSGSKVCAENEEDAKKAAFALYAYRGAMGFPGRTIENTVESVEPAEDCVVNGVNVQPAVEYALGDPETRKKLGLDSIVAGGRAFSFSDKKIVSIKRDEKGFPDEN